MYEVEHHYKIVKSIGYAVVSNREKLYPAPTL